VFHRLATDWDPFIITPERFLSDGETVVVLARYNATYRATGKSIDVPVAHVWTVESGQVKSFRQYVDTLVVNRAMQ